MGVLHFIRESGVAGYVIVVLGIFGVVIVIDRVKALYFDYSIKTDTFINQVKGLIMNNQMEEAINFCGANEKVPLAHVIKSILSRADRDDESIAQGLDIAMTEVIPLLGRRLGYLSMVSNVATLVGLLGTIQGLILSFEAVSFADPSQKQTLLAQGISLAMSTTAMGLSVAIPIMIVYAFLHARQARLLEQISEYSTKIIDILAARHTVPFTVESAFPRNLGSQAIEQRGGGTPPPQNKIG
jgi:biopolymer transport protein ExbB/TolQ